MVPPGVAAVVVAVVEGGALVAHEAVDADAHRVAVAAVAAQGYGEAEVALHVELAPLAARGEHFAQQVVVQPVALLLNDLCAEG